MTFPVSSAAKRRNSGPFVTQWRTTNAGTSASNQISIPTLSGRSYNCWVDWGDGTKSSLITTYNDPQWTHTFATSGTFIVKINGTFSMGFGNAGDRLKLINLIQWGCLNLSQSSNTFYGCANMIITATDIPFLGYPSINLQFMFRGCTSIQSIPNLNKWDMSRVISLSNFLNGCSNWNDYVGDWNVSQNTNFSGLFAACTKFTGGGVSRWNVSSGQNFLSTFFMCPNINPDFSGWNMLNATSLQNMFYQSTGITGIGLQNWSLPNVTTTNNMFTGCAGLTTVNLASWGLGKATDMQFMFYQCTNFVGNGLPAWTTNLVQNMSSMLYQCTSFNQNISSWNTSNVTTMQNMFQGASAFNQNIGSWNITSLTNATSMFSGVTLSNTNYNLLLNGWSLQAVKPNVVFSGGNSHYDTTSGGVNGDTSRAILTNSPNLWTITDGGTP